MPVTTNGLGPYAETDAHARSTDPPIDADVIVVGAGPAGSATATHLARHGLQRLTAGEEPVSTREGLRRRPDAARHQAADPARY